MAKGWTLVELLVVIATIGLLAGLLIPAVSSARMAAHKVRAQAQFRGWANALLQYKAEYGYWPPVLGQGGFILGPENQDDFIIALSGRRADGSAISTEVERKQNRKAIPFYTFSNQEFDAAGECLVDPFGNPNIRIAVDENGNGQIDLTEASSLPEDTPSPLRAQVVLWVLDEGARDYVQVTTWD